MVVETLALVCAWHPGHEDDYNAATPGVIVSAIQPVGADWLQLRASAGAYIDSYRNLAAMYGVGCDIGRDFGIGLTIARVDGSDMERYPVVPIPSVYYRCGDHGIRIICAPDATAFAFGYTYTFKP